MTLAAQKELGNCFQMDTLGVDGDGGVVLVKRCSFVFEDLRGRVAAARSGKIVF